jgi:integrase
MRTRGTGSIRKRKQGGYQVRYYTPQHGYVEESVARVLRKPSALVTEKDARDLLKARISEIQRGTFLGAERTRITVLEALDNYIADLSLRGAKDMKQAKMVARFGAARFGALRAAELTSRLLRTWADELARDEYAPATIQQRLAVLRAALKLAHREGALALVPAFPRIAVDNARTGFFEPDQVAAVIGHLPPNLADVVRFGHQTGWRKQEILDLQWTEVDRGQGVIRVIDSKNDDGSVLPLVGAIADLIESRWKQRALGCPYVFHRRGRRIRTFDQAWRKACVAAGVPGRWFHDLRRSAAKDLVESGADYAEAMAVTRHRSMAVFLRYRIVDTRATARALARLQAHRLMDRTGSKENASVDSRAEVAVSMGGDRYGT